jgi:hypothetical protein
MAGDFCKQHGYEHQWGYWLVNSSPGDIRIRTPDDCCTYSYYRECTTMGCTERQYAEELVASGKTAQFSCGKGWEWREGPHGGPYWKKL